ncbi:hypothetical protein KCP76_00955 [Salmonella enterica subsp. enterica serovar Weltevreden]|nr:hypothetical protein KCP76_00955 [Salmonella enterica subsp. enterica serovar Weltevreden]
MMRLRVLRNGLWWRRDKPCFDAAALRPHAWVGSIKMPRVATVHRAGGFPDVFKKNPGALRESACSGCPVA